MEENACRLHLNSLSSFGVGPIYTATNAPGLILATGNIGNYLDEEKADTYLSNNGGLSFKKIANGSHIYQIGDQGSLIVMARDDKEVQKIKFSWNNGKTFEEMLINEKPLFVTNIVIESSHKGLIFQVYGVLKDDSSGFVVPVNFENLMPRRCVHDEYGDSDYETWSPHSSTGKCINGEKMVYLRRKPERACFNSDEVEMVRRDAVCKCEAEDWECDIGFVREKESGACVRSSDGKSGPFYEPPKKCVDFYKVRTGYRKVAGNVCENGVDLGAHMIQCPDQHNKG